MAGVAGASISSPGPYDKEGNTYYNVGSLAGWSPEKGPKATCASTTTTFADTMHSRGYTGPLHAIGICQSIAKYYKVCIG
jgi:hypothetical protein